MHLSTLSTLSLLAPAALTSPLQKCSTNSTLPCQCPNGTSYDQSVTFAIIGAGARDVTAVVDDFFHPDWYGITGYKTQGTNNVPGALRTANLATRYGVYALEELLTTQLTLPTGSFAQRFELSPRILPLAYTSRNGSFGGYWVTLAVNPVFGDESAVTWSVFACTTGEPIDYKSFHESALQNVTDVLQKQGKITGKNVKPFTVE